MLTQEEHCRLSIGFLLLLFLPYLFIYFTILFTLLSVCIVLEWAGGEGQVGERRRRTRNRKRKRGLRMKPTDINTVFVMSIMSCHYMLTGGRKDKNMA